MNTSEKQKECMQGRSTLGKVMRVIGMIIAAAFGIAAMALIFGYGVMYLWNWLMPKLFGLGTIGYWQAVGLIALAKLLFGHFGHHWHPHEGIKEKHGARKLGKFLSKYPEMGTAYDDYMRYWEEEGHAAFKAYRQRKADGNGNHQ